MLRTIKIRLEGLRKDEFPILEAVNENHIIFSREAIKIPNPARNL